MGRTAGIGGMRHSSGVARLRAATPRPAVSAVRAGARAYGEMTARFRPLPDFLVIGAKKGGTTSLANWLAAHPDVLPMFPRWQRRKSPHYFDINYHRGLRWYRSHFPSSGRRAYHERRYGATSRVGESSPYYLFHPWAAERIQETIPNAKLVAVLRDPVSRAYSHYWDRVATGFEPLGSFEEAIDAEEGRMAGVSLDSLRDPGAYSHHHDNHTYLARGLYAEQLERYFALFSRDQMLVLSANALFERPAREFERIERFLGLRSVPARLDPVNVRSGKPRLDPATAERLRAFYAAHNEALYELLGEDLNW